VVVDSAQCRCWCPLGSSVVEPARRAAGQSRGDRAGDGQLDGAGGQAAVDEGWAAAVNGSGAARAR
jgi:hypothetical protein